jgi:hypothetical protein
MKKQLLMLGMILLPTLAMAAPPDFSGSWARDAADSDAVPNLMYWMTRVAPAAPRGGAAAGGAAAAGGRGGGGGGRGGGAAVIMTVQQDAKGLHQAESQAIVRDYVLDGHPHTKTTDTGIQKAEVTAQLEPDKLVIDTTEPFGGMPGNVGLKIKEVWTLSPDGKTLTITTTRDIPARHEQYKEVYTRTQAQPGAMCSAGCVTPN